ncbi:acyltransferase [Dokdonella soli]|uniref:Acyltransferase n=2 Tax=Dokdonella soli TaxID=529810 RepID=A0ABN1IGD3_9GAMM
MSSHWSERPEGGGWFALWLIRTIGLGLGRSVARSLLYPITLYFYFRRPFERRVSYAFLQRAFGRPASAWQVMRHIHRFASTILDRVFLLADRFARFDVRIHGLDELTSRMRPERGVLLLGAHVGSFEVLRVAAAERPDVKVRVVLDTQQTPALTELLHALNPEIARNVIDASRPGTEIVLALGEAIGEGALATLLADRARPHEATVVVDFLGAPAAFPVAPFLIGSVLKAPIVLCFGMYRGGNRYDLYFEAFADELTLARRERGAETRALVQRYAARLEHHVRHDPYNWFNWHDFWKLESEGGDATAAGEPALGKCERAGPSMSGRAT